MIKTAYDFGEADETRYFYPVCYTVLGTLFGVLIWIIALIIALSTAKLSFTVHNIAAAYQACTLLWIITPTPIILGLFSLSLGMKKNQIKTLIHFLTYRVETQTDKLSGANRRLENILYYMADLIVVLDDKGVIQQVNNSTIRHFGFEERDLLDQSGDILFGKEDFSKIMINDSSDLFNQGFISEIEGAYKTREGGTIYLEISISRFFNDKGEFEGVICVAQDITEKRQQQQSLEEAKFQFEALFNAAPLPIVIIQNKKIKFFNQAAANHLQYTAEEFSGISIDSFIHPDDINKTKIPSSLESLDNNELKNGISFRVNTKTGETRYVELHSKSFLWQNHSAFLNFIIDNTDREQMEAALAESEKKFRDLVQSLNIIILKLDPQFRFTFMNKFGETFFGYKESEILGKNALAYIVPEVESTGRNLHKLVSSLLHNPKDFVDNENENVKRNGERAWVSWRNQPIFNEAGQLTELMSTGIDVTDQKAAEIKILEQNLLLQQYQKRMEEELSQARKAQTALIRNEIPEIEGLTISVKYVPMTKIGGDFYDITHRSDDRIKILVGDVTGHGIPAALLSFLFMATFKNILVENDQPELAIIAANQFLAGKLPPGKYATIFYSLFDPETQKLKYASAGHPPAFLIRKDAEEIIKLNTSGTVVGLFDEPAIPFSCDEVQLIPGDRVIIYTDGIIEVFDENNQLQSDDELSGFIMKNKHMALKSLMNAIYDYCLSRANQERYNDDVTMIGMEVGPEVPDFL